MTLKRGLTRLEGVADAKLIVKPAHMEVTMKPGYWPDLLKMEDTTKRAGYKPVPENIGLIVTGKLTREGEAYSVELEGMQTPTTLRLEPGKVDAAQLSSAAGKPVRLEGKWTPPPGGAAGAGTLVLMNLATTG